MRSYNRDHPGHEVRFFGNDLNYPTLGTELTRRVLDYVRAHRPEQVQAFTELYRVFTAQPDAKTYLALPHADRLAIAESTRQAERLLRGIPGPDADWVRQHARSIAQTATGLAFDYADPAQSRAGMEFRDRVMAENTAWWRARTGQKILLSAHNGHVAYVSDLPETHPKSQGGFLRELLGREYLVVGLTFDHGSFNAKGPDGRWTRCGTGTTCWTCAPCRTSRG